MDVASFRAFYSRVESKPTSDAKIKEIHSRVTNHYNENDGKFIINCQQLGELMKLVNFANLREEVAKICGNSIVDWDEVEKRELFFRNCKPWERDDLTRAVESNRSGGGGGSGQQRQQHEREELTPSFYPKPHKAPEQQQMDIASAAANMSIGNVDEEAAKRNLVVTATEEMNAQRGEKNVFTFNMEWMDINTYTAHTAAIANAVQTDENTFLPGLVNDREWSAKTPMQRLRDTKWVPPKLVARGVSEDEFTRLCDILISAFEKLPFTKMRGGPGVSEFFYFRFPLGPICCVLQTMNPITWLIYTPFETDIKERALPAMNDILRRHNLKAVKPSNFNKAIAIVEM